MKHITFVTSMSPVKMPTHQSHLGTDHIYIYSWKKPFYSRYRLAPLLPTMWRSLIGTTDPRVCVPTLPRSQRCHAFLTFVLLNHFKDGRYCVWLLLVNELGIAYYDTTKFLAMNGENRPLVTDAPVEFEK